MRRLRLNVTDVSPGYVTCSLFQSSNSVNWGCVGTGITFPDEWFAKTFDSAEPEVGERIEFGLGTAVKVGP
ncbi:MAG TPA: hypothetical protein VGK43_02665 [Solirubrobacterales bacterium]